MKRLLVLLVATAPLAACQKPDFMKSAAELATPVPATPPPAPPATPKPPEWMWKTYKNPLEQRPKK